MVGNPGSDGAAGAVGIVSPAIATETRRTAMAKEFIFIIDYSCYVEG
jgi:hypothetical protein